MSNNFGNDEELILSFITETRDRLDEVEPQLIELQDQFDEAGAGEETVNTIFRLFHSIKGSAGFLAFNNITKVTHEAETLLDLFRKGNAKFEAKHTDILCRSCDFIRIAMDLVESTMSDKGVEPEAEEIIEELRKTIEEEKNFNFNFNFNSTAYSESEGINPGQEPSSFTKVDNFSSSQEAGENELVTDDMVKGFIQESEELLERTEGILLELEKKPANFAELVNAAFRNIHSFKGGCGILGYSDFERLSHKIETVLNCIKDGKIESSKNNINILLKIMDILRGGVADLSKGGHANIQGCDVMLMFLDEELPTPKDSQPVPPPSEKADPKETSQTRQERSAVPPTNTTKANNNIRVSLEKLDSLINLVGELVTATAMVVHNPDLEGHEYENFERSANHMTKIVRNLQGVAMAVRMIPIAGTFRRMIRLVHDLSRKAGKKIKLEIKGEETEIDKTVTEQISDPLVHIIRNAIDHGIETQEERKSAGKSETGTIHIEAKHEGGEVWITIKDDGGGLSREKILAKAVERGMVKADNDLSDAEILKLIFEPGFSTAEKVTDISGRGVGMDVVKRNIETELKGNIDVQSKIGEGSVFILRIPLTLAIIEGMLIRVGQNRYIIPLLAIKESIKVNPKNITRTMDGQEIVKVRDDLIPVTRLHEFYNISPDSCELHEGILVIIENNKKTVCLFVDEMLGQYQTVIKGLSDYIGHAGTKNTKGISGCTILGNGDVSLILDPSGITNEFG